MEVIRRDYPDEWLLVEVVEDDEAGNVTKGVLVAHDKDRDVIHRKQRGLRGDYYIFWNGPIPREGYVFGF